jgi:AraC-like DNA-binding protein
VVVRTYPVTFLHDRVERRCEPRWHAVTYAARGTLEVEAGGVRHLVPADRAVVIPAGTAHTVTMRAPIAVRSLFIAAPAARRGFERVRVVAVTPLLRELIIHACGLGALDRRRPTQGRLAALLFDLVASADEVTLALPSPREPRAARFAALIAANPGDPRENAALARACGASLRTLERVFRAETGVAIATWRRRVRLFHALRLLDGGAAVGAVASEVGYRSASAFGQAFARQFGRSPRTASARPGEPITAAPARRRAAASAGASTETRRRRRGPGPGRR